MAYIVHKWGTKNNWPDININIFPKGWTEGYIHEYFLQFNKKFNKEESFININDFFDE